MLNNFADKNQCLIPEQRAAQPTVKEILAVLRETRHQLEELLLPKEKEPPHHPQTKQQDRISEYKSGDGITGWSLEAYPQNREVRQANGVNISRPARINNEIETRVSEQSSENGIVKKEQANYSTSVPYGKIVVNLPQNPNQISAPSPSLRYEKEKRANTEIQESLNGNFILPRIAKIAQQRGRNPEKQSRIQLPGFNKRRNRKLISAVHYFSSSSQIREGESNQSLNEVGSKKFGEQPKDSPMKPTEERETKNYDLTPRKIPQIQFHDQIRQFVVRIPVNPAERAEDSIKSLLGALEEFNPFFQRIHRAISNCLLRLGHFLQVKPNTKLYATGQPLTSLFIILEGKVKIAGKIKRLCVAGETLAEEILFHSSKGNTTKRLALGSQGKFGFALETAKAKGTAWVLSLDIDVFLRLKRQLISSGLRIQYEDTESVIKRNFIVKNSARLKEAYTSNRL